MRFFAYISQTVWYIVLTFSWWQTHFDFWRWWSSRTRNYNSASLWHQTGESERRDREDCARFVVPFHSCFAITFHLPITLFVKSESSSRLPFSFRTFEIYTLHRGCWTRLCCLLNRIINVFVTTYIAHICFRNVSKMFVWNIL